jgi:large subunit ribosomal protein L13
MTTQEYILDAKGKILGRIASEAAILLRGKNHADYLPYLTPTNKVVITNAGKIRVTGQKREQNVYIHYTGYPGGKREIPFERVFQKNPGEVIRKTVLGMLPRNKQRAKIIKNLTIYNGERE